MSIETPLENPFRVNVAREFAMTRFSGSNEAVDARGNRASAERPVLLDSSTTMAGMLLAAVVAAALVVADQLIETWADGHLLVAWVVLWVITFAVLSLLMPSLRQISSILVSKLRQWSAKRAERIAQAELWNWAQHDYRVMAELRSARDRDL